jgi:effector-binding domain-containing protein
MTDILTMKWVLIGIGVLGLVFGAAFGVGYFLVSPSLKVAQSIQIDRHPSMVYPLTSNLALFHEWSPWARMDPGQRYEVQGSAGQGQTARFKSNVSQIGEGAYAITAVTPHAAVRMRADGGPMATGLASVTLDVALEEASGGALTTWTLTRDCGTGLDSVVCRYLNLMVAGSAQVALEQGLTRLKRLAEGLPALDISDVTVNVETRTGAQFAYVESAAEKDDPIRVTQAILGAANYVQQFFIGRQLPQSGPRVVVMTKDDDRQVSFRVGYMYEGPAIVDAAPPVRVGETPSGKAAKLTHIGAPEQMQVSYALFNAYLRAHRIQTDGLPWEVYVKAATREDQSDAQVDIYIPVK